MSLFRFRVRIEQRKSPEGQYAVEVTQYRNGVADHIKTTFWDTFDEAKQAARASFPSEPADD